MLVKDVYGDEYHLNPRQVVMITSTIDGDHCVELSNYTTLWPDDDSYDRIIKWMEKHDG